MWDFNIIRLFLCQIKLCSDDTEFKDHSQMSAFNKASINAHKRPIWNNHTLCHVHNTSRKAQTDIKSGGTL